MSPVPSAGAAAARTTVPAAASPGSIAAHGDRPGDARVAAGAAPRTDLAIATAGPPALALALAAAGPLAIGGILAAAGGTPAPLVAVPAVVFGVVAATAPALYIASAVTGSAPSLGAVIRAFGTALGAFGVALAGLLLPAAFLALSSRSPGTTLWVATAALGAAGVLALRRLARELAPAGGPPALAASCVYVVWCAATLGIAGQLWLDLAREVAW